MTGNRSDRFYPAHPLVGVGAVVWDGARVLLEQRGKAPMAGSWTLPGGLVELGEPVTAAVAREVAEECGIQVRVGPLLGVFEPMERDGEGRVHFHFIVLDYLAYYESGELQVGDDAADARWMLPEELAAFEVTQPAREMIERALRILSGRETQT